MLKINNYIILIGIFLTLKIVLFPIIQDSDKVDLNFGILINIVSYLSLFLSPYVALFFFNNHLIKCEKKVFHSIMFLVGSILIVIAGTYSFYWVSIKPTDGQDAMVLLGVPPLQLLIAWLLFRIVKKLSVRLSYK